MNLRERLKKDDPLASEPLPDAAELDRMRRAIVAAADETVTRTAAWRPVWIAASIVLVAIVLGIGRAARVEEPGDGGTTARSAAPAGQAESRRQLHFVTAGGTRVIWILNEEFDEWNQR